MDFEYGIIGGGPAGYTAAIMLAKQEKKVVLFEKDKIGGTCLNRGCIPTKALMHLSEEYKTILNSSSLGLDIEIKNFDFAQIIQKRNNITDKIRKSLELAVKSSGVNIVYSEADIVDKNHILANGTNYSVNNIIYAAGANPRELKGLEFDHKFILSSDDLLKLDSLPKSVLIVGSGAIGIEWARIFSNFGSEVIVVEKAEHLIPVADIDVSKRMERIFKQNKIKFYLNNSVVSIKNHQVTIETGETFEPEILLSAVGRTPMKLNCDGVTVLGDSTGEVQLAHYGIHQAKEYATSISFNKELIPSVIYGEPEIAWVGKREQDCIDECKSTIFPVTALGKSWCDNCTDGFIKIITKNDLIIGAHIISKEASALVHEFLIAMQNKITINNLKEVCFAHPTYSEGIFEAICRI